MRRSPLPQPGEIRTFVHDGICNTAMPGRNCPISIFAGQFRYGCEGSILPRKAVAQFCIAGSRFDGFRSQEARAASLATSLSHAFGAAFDNPDLIVGCVVGDGDAETGPLATSWHSNKFLNPVRDGGGAADPASQRLQDRQPQHPRRASVARSWSSCSGAMGTTPYFVEGFEPDQQCTKLMAATLDEVIGDIQRIKADARTNGFSGRPRWPMIVLRSPKGWTCPKEIDGTSEQKTIGAPTRCRWARLHGESGTMCSILEEWMQELPVPTELFDDRRPAPARARGARASRATSG